MAVAIDATAQDVYPPRVLVAVTGLTLGDDVVVYRQVAGQRTPVRAGSAEDVADTSFLVIDAELPFGVPVTYVAVVNGADTYETTADTYTLPGGKVAVSDAIQALAAEVVILAWPEKTYPRQVSVFQVGGRNAVVSGPIGQASGTIELFVETTSASRNLDEVLRAATEGVVQIRQPGGYDGVDSYQAVLSATERRFSQDGSDERRIWSLDAAETDGWSPGLVARGFTYDDLAAAYTGLDYDDLEGDYATYLDLARADLST